MFPGLEPLDVPEGALLTLANAMKDAEPESAEGDSNISAGFTYLGQFIDHDITLDLTPLDLQNTDPQATRNFRTPQLDLDSLYGAGPAIAPYLYDRDARGKPTGKILVGKTEASQNFVTQTEIPGGDFDLPRSRYGRAIIGDERNDENLLVSQTHLALLKFHNVVVDRVKVEKPQWDIDAVFDEARRITTWHYQWIVLFDFVERLTEKGLVRKIKEQGRKFYRFKKLPYIPVEFSAAAYRLGHSMVRENYNHNAVFNGPPGAPNAGSLKALFHFTGKSGAILGDRASEADPNDFPIPQAGVFERLPSNWTIDWRRFYDFETPPEAGFALNHARKIDPMIVPQLHTLPGEQGNSGILPFRNLLRGVNLELPSAQAIGAKIRQQTAIDMLSVEDLTSGSGGDAIRDGNMQNATPLWYYILREAEVMHDGQCLGPLGSILVAETFLGIVHGDHESFMWRVKDWKPDLPSAEPGNFTMVDMLNMVGDLHPVGAV